MFVQIEPNEVVQFGSEKVEPNRPRPKIFSRTKPTKLFIVEANRKNFAYSLCHKHYVQEY